MLLKRDKFSVSTQLVRVDFALLVDLMAFLQLVRSNLRKLWAEIAQCLAVPLQGLYRMQAMVSRLFPNGHFFNRLRYDILQK